jgi:hypothetical protein
MPLVMRKLRCSTIFFSVCAGAEAERDIFELDEAFGLAVGGGEVDAGGGGLDALVDVAQLADEFVRVVDAGLGLGGAGLGAAAQPLDLGLDAVLQASCSLDCASR